MAFIGKQPDMAQVDFEVQSGTGTAGASGSIMFHNTSGLVQHINGDWAALTASVGVLDTLTDVNSAGHASGQLIQSNGTTWELVDHDMEAIIDLDTTTNTPVSTANLALRSVGDGTYAFAAMDLSTNVGGDLGDLDNVNTAGHADGFALTSNGTTFIMEALDLSNQVGGGLTDLDDVAAVASTSGQVLMANGSSFVMNALTLGDEIAGALNDLSDVSTAGVATDEVLIYNGSSYVTEALVGGSNVTVAVSGLSNLDTTTNSPESTAGLSLVSDGDATYSFAEMTTARMTVSSISADQNPAVVNNMYIMDSSGGVKTVTLPANHASGDRVIVKCAGSSQTNAITIATADSDTIDGEDTQILSSNYGAIECVSNGTNWFLI